MQSGTLEVFSYAPTSFPAEHPVYDPHNAGNSVLQVGWVPHHFVYRRQMGLPTRFNPPISFAFHVESRGTGAKFFFVVGFLPVANQQERALLPLRQLSNANTQYVV